MSATAPSLGANVQLKRFLFGTYSFAENLLLLLLEVLLHPLRFLIFKVLLVRVGTKSMIDYQTYFRYPWKVSIGNGVWINRGCEFYGSKLAGHAQITIGDHCALGLPARELSAKHNYHQLGLHDEAASVHIGYHVWIGAGATVLPVATVSDGAIVAAAIVVTRDIVPFSIVAGNPALFLEMRELDDEHSIQ